jgi:hypothetical protein
VTGYWPSVWPAEDGGPARRQLAPGGLGRGARLHVTSRMAPAMTMAVVREPDELFVLRHTTGEGATAFVERVDPRTLEPGSRSDDLAGGPFWPGSLGAHANGSLYVVFGNHAHRLDPELRVVASHALPRARPYNGFAVLPDGHLVTKDFAGSRPGVAVAEDEREPCELLVLEPERLAVVERVALPEPSIARLSLDGDTVYVVGDTSLQRVRGSKVDDGFVARYRTIPGQTYGWDSVIALGAAWFLDNGEGTERFTGTLRGNGISTAPLHLVRVDLATAEVAMTEICGRPRGLIANPPVVDEGRRIAVGYDSGNGVMAAFAIGEHGELTPLWTREQDHACHLVLFPETGELVTGDHRPDHGEDLVVLDIETGRELARAASGSPLQSVVFPAVGPDGVVYYCSFSTLARVSPEPPG